MDLYQQVLNLELHDLGLDYLSRYCEGIQAVTLEAARQAAHTHLYPDALTALVVGPAAKCRSALEEMGRVTLLEGI